MVARAAHPVSDVWLVCAAGLLVASAALAPLLAPGPWTWGVAHPKALATPAHVALALAAPLALAALGRALGTAGARGAGSTGAGWPARVARSPWAWAALVASAGLLVPNSVPYGDAVRFYRFVPGASEPDANAPLSFEAHRALAALRPSDLVAAFSVLSTLGGLLAVFALARLGRALFPDDARRRGLFFLGMTASGAWQLFAGYVEHYHVQLALVLWGAALWMEDARGDGRASAASGVRRLRGPLVMGLAAAWNLSAAWLAPAALAAPLAARDRRGALRAAGAFALPVAAAFALLAALHGPPAVVEAIRGGFHPIAAPGGGFVRARDLLGGPHALFLANDALLVAPLALALAPPALAAAFARRIRRARGAEGGAADAAADAGAGASAGADAALRAVRRALALCALAFVAVWSPRLGWSKDWDLYAWPLFLLQALALSSALDREDDITPRRARAWIGLIAAAQTLALLFVLSNSRFGSPR